MWWNKVTTFLGDVNPLINLLSTVLWGIYVYFTIKTFNEMSKQTEEIEKQTELQREAFLVVSKKIGERNNDMENHINEKFTSLFDKWNNILKTNIPDALQTEDYIILRLYNRGKSDIISWKIKFNVGIKAGDYLSENLNINGEEDQFYIESSGHKDLIASGDSIEIVIAMTGVFPRLKMNWEIEYEDMRGVDYVKFGGDTMLTDSNALATQINKDDVIESDIENRSKDSGNALSK